MAALPRRDVRGLLNVGAREGNTLLIQLRDTV